ncbi:conserved protein of unknown function [Hyphomicrobium sp. 1Nfss2.1]
MEPEPGLEMRMIAIVISACLVSNPSVCKDYRVPLAYDVDSQRCLFEAQPHLPRWAEAHPTWQIKKWRCAAADQQDL